MLAAGAAGVSIKTVSKMHISSERIIVPQQIERPSIILACRMSRIQAFQGFDISFICQTFLLLMLLVYTTADVPSRISDNVIVCDYDRDLPPIISIFKNKYTEHLNSFPCQYIKQMQKSKSWMDASQTIESYHTGNDRDNSVSSSGTETSNQTQDKRSMPFHLPLQQDGYFVRGISMFGTRNPIVEGFKRGPGFRSWGGKRTMATKEGPENAIKRTEFPF